MPFSAAVTGPLCDAGAVTVQWTVAVPPAGTRPTAVASVAANVQAVGPDRSACTPVIAPGPPFRTVSATVADCPGDNVVGVDGSSASATAAVSPRVTACPPYCVTVADRLTERRGVLTCSVALPSSYHQPGDTLPASTRWTGLPSRVTRCGPEMSTNFSWYPRLARAPG